MANVLLLTGVLAVTPIAGREIYRMDLSAYPHNHALTRQEAAELFQARSILTSSASRVFDAGLIKVENDPFGGTGKVLSIQFRGGTAGLGSAENPSGGQWRVGFGGKTYDDLYMSVQLGVDDEWVSPKSIHLPFLCSDPFRADVEPNPDVWANFFQLTGNNSYIDSITTPINPNTAEDAIAFYYYTLTRAQKFAWFNTADPTKVSKSALPTNTGQVELARNGYVTLEQRLKLNSVTSYDNPTADGLQQAWADGQPAVHRENVKWRRDASQKMEYAWALFWTGGGQNNPDYFQPKDQKMYMKSLIISTEPITH